MRQTQTDDIREAVLRNQLTHVTSGSKTDNEVYFLSVGEKHEDPSDDFVKRLAKFKVLIRKASESERRHGRVVDKKTGEKGAILSVTSIRWISDNEVEVDCSYDQGVRAASGFSVTVKEDNGKWSVTREKRTWAS